MKRGSIFETDGIPRMSEALPLAMQHVVAMIVGCVTPAIIVSGAVPGGLSREDQVILIQSALVIAALSTLLQLDKIPAEKARLEIEKTNNRIYEASGIYPSYVRPPFGAWIKDMELSVTMLPVFWDVDTLDWKSKNIDSILSIAQKQVHDGSIILMHDGYQTSVDAALKIADLFTEKGYVFVTADQLLLT